MHIELERTGGFAGLTMRKAVDSKDLSPEEKSRLTRLVDDANLLQMPPVIPSSGPGADRFHYKLTVDFDGNRHTVDVDEAAATPALKSLIQWIAAAPSRP